MDKNQDSYKMTYQAAAATNVVISAEPAFLHSVIVGASVGGSLEISDHATDGDGNVVIFLDAPTTGTYVVDAAFDVGITVDMIVQTLCTFVWR